MSTPMTISEAQQRIYTLQEELTDLVQTFEADTGLSVSYIRAHKADIAGGRLPKTVAVELEVRA